jgi:hypothetical protein
MYKVEHIKNKNNLNLLDVFKTGTNGSALPTSRSVIVQGFCALAFRLAEKIVDTLPFRHTAM